MSQTEILSLSPNQLVASQCNMRPLDEGEDLSELVNSIRSQGILNPLLVRPVSGRDGGGQTKYEVYAGHRRLSAARTLELTEVPCLSTDISDVEAQLRSLVENYQRLEPSFYDKIKTFKRLYDNLEQFDTSGVSVGNASMRTTFETGRIKSLCSLVGVKGKTLKRYLKLANLPDSILRRLDRCGEDTRVSITLGNAELLLSVPDNCQVDLVEQMVASQLSGPEMEMVIRSFIKTPNSDNIPDLVNMALEKSGQDRKITKTETSERDERASVQEEGRCHSDVVNGDGISNHDSSLEDSTVNRDEELRENSNNGNEDSPNKEVKVSKKDPWLYDPSDKRRKPHAIPSDQISAFWDLYVSRSNL